MRRDRILPSSAKRRARTPSSGAARRDRILPSDAKRCDYTLSRRGAPEIRKPLFLAGAKRPAVRGKNQLRVATAATFLLSTLTFLPYIRNRMRMPNSSTLVTASPT